MINLQNKKVSKRNDTQKWFSVKQGVPSGRCGRFCRYRNKSVRKDQHEHKQQVSGYQSF